MSLLKASRLKSALAKAKRAGQVEEAVTLAGLPLVVASLPSEEYGSIMEEVEDYSELSYNYAYQVECVSHAIVEIDGESLRESTYIEDERPELDEDGKPTGEMVPVKVERFRWLRDNYVSTWTHEVVAVAFRKFLEACNKAELISKEGVVFTIEDESDEEKYRRLLAELAEVSTELPDDMKEAILKEHDLLQATSEAELQEIHEQAQEFLKEREKAAEATDEEPPPEPPPEPEEAPEAPSGPVQTPSQLIEAARADLDRKIAERQPMNQEAIKPPVPQNAQVQPTRTRGPVPDQVVSQNNLSAKYAALERDADTANLLGDIQDLPPQDLRKSEDQVFLDKDPVGPVDAKVAAASIVRHPPKGGVNKKFVDPHTRPGINPRTRRKA